MSKQGLFLILVVGLLIALVLTTGASADGSAGEVAGDGMASSTQSELEAQPVNAAAPVSDAEAINEATQSELEAQPVNAVAPESDAQDINDAISSPGSGVYVRQ